MSEKDIDLKLACRRLAWDQGFATRINVPLRSYIEQKPGRPGHEEYTDLDVLAIATNPSGQVQSQIFDCKSTSSRTTERMFWLRGVADFFSASDAWMVRPLTVTAAARQLAGRLNLGVMAGEDLRILGAIAGGAGSGGSRTVTPAIERLFDKSVVEKLRRVHTTADKRLRNLIDYCNYDFWVYPEYQNLSQMVAHLRSAASTLDGKIPAHNALFFECVWLYTLALAHASDYVRRTNASAPQDALLEYYLGGQLLIREKQAIASEFGKLAGKSPSLEPDYFRSLIETFTRIYVRPSVFTAMMRYSEVAAVNLADGRRPYLSGALNGEYDTITAKLLYDVCVFLIGSARLSPSFRDSVREIALGTRPAGATDASASEQLPDREEADGADAEPKNVCPDTGGADA